MAANSMLSRLRAVSMDHAEEPQKKESEPKFHKKRSRNLNQIKKETSQGKSGWIKKRSRIVKQWRKRFAQIKEDQYLCTYKDDLLKHCTETIDITQASIYYSINSPKAFNIYLAKENTYFDFECDTVEEANDWLIHLKHINESYTQPATTNTQQPNDLDLITNAGADFIITDQIQTCRARNGSPEEPGNEQKVSDSEVNQLYMKAIGLYQHQFYPQCQDVIKSVLALQPNHREALKLFEYLINREYEKVNDKKSKKKKSRRRFKTVAVTKTTRTPKDKTKSSGQKQRFSLWNKQSDKEVASTAADMTRDEFKEEEIVKESPPQAKLHPCQLEFRRFLTERIQLNKYYDDLVERFEMAKYNDIRFLKDFDRDTLTDEIGLRPLHVKCFLRKIEIFMNEVKLFEVWLEEIVMTQKKANQFNGVTSEGLMDLFENNGITTFEALYRYIKSKDDLERIMTGEDDLQLTNDMVYDVIWNSMDHIEKKQRSRIGTVDQTYKQINSAILGVSEDEMYIEEMNMEGADDVRSNEKEGAQEETALISH
eukprot:206437_1